MKKIFVITLMMFIMTGCNSKSEFEQAIENMIGVTKVSINLEYKNGLFDGLTSKIVIDEEKVKVTDLENDTYYIIEDENMSFLSDIRGINYKAPIIFNEEFDGKGEVDEIMPDFTLFFEEDFRLEDGYYVTDKIINEMIEISILIENEYITEINYKQDSDEETFEFIMKFSEIGTASIEFPSYIEPSGFEEKALLFMGSSFIFVDLEDGFTFFGYILLVTLHEAEEYYVIESSTLKIEYYINTKVVNIFFGDTPYPYTTTLNEYFEGDIDKPLTLSQYEALDEIYILID